MTKAVLISIKPKWCELIALGKKKIEIRKTKPSITPFKAYIYCSKGAPYLNRHNGVYYLEERDTLGGRGCGVYERLNGRIIGEFVCDETETLYEKNATGSQAAIEEMARLTLSEFCKYVGKGTVYGWHISELVMYEKPKQLSEFFRENKYTSITKAPQSWCYVEDLSSKWRMAEKEKIEE